MRYARVAVLATVMATLYVPPALATESDSDGAVDAVGSSSSTPGSSSPGSTSVSDLETISFNLGDRPRLGDPAAPMVLVEFTDYECPFCRQFHLGAYERIKQQYIDSGKLLFVSVDLPLDFHRNARMAAHAARCAGDQDRFWELRHVLIENGARLSGNKVQSLAKNLGLDMDQYRQCMIDRTHLRGLRSDITISKLLGMTGTPTFILAPNDGEDRITGIKIPGAQPWSVFNKLLEWQLEQVGG